MAVPGYRIDVKRRAIHWLSGLRHGYEDRNRQTERLYRRIIEKAGVDCPD